MGNLCGNMKSKRLAADGVAFASKLCQSMIGHLKLFDAFYFCCYCSTHPMNLYSSLFLSDNLDISARLKFFFAQKNLRNNSEYIKENTENQKMHRIQV